MQIDLFRTKASNYTKVSTTDASFCIKLLQNC